MKRLALIQPNSAFVSESIPLGFGWIAAVLKNKGIEVKIIDASAAYSRYSDDDIVRLCKEFNADAVGVVFMTSHVYKAYDLVKKLSELKVPIIGGGYHVTKFPNEVLSRGVDIGMMGEAEVTITEIVDYLNGKMKIEDVKGISYKKDNEIIINPPRPLIQNLDDLPLPDREAFILSDFARSEKEIKNVMSTLITSRGCPFECSFCASQKTGYRFRSADNVLKEIRQVKEKYGTRNFYLVDDTINVHRKRLIELCEALKGEDIVWRCNGRFDLMDEELLIKMKEAGCIHISLGVESGDDEVLKRMHKKLTANIIREKAKLIHDVGISQTLNFMFGFPFETPESIEKTIQLIKDIEPYITDIQRAGLLIPFPGTTLYEEFKTQYNYDQWWLRPEDFMTEVRESDHRPIFKKFLFDDLGLINEKGKFFEYSDEMIKKIKKGMRTIDHIVMKRKVHALNFTKSKFVEKAIYMAMLGMIYSSKGLYNLNPNIERKVIHPLYYSVRRNKYYLKNRTY